MSTATTEPVHLVNPHVDPQLLVERLQTLRPTITDPMALQDLDRRVSKPPRHITEMGVQMVVDDLLRAEAIFKKKQEQEREKQRQHRRSVLRAMRTVSINAISPCVSFGELVRDLQADAPDLVPSLGIVEMGLSGWFGQPGCGKSKLAAALASAAALGEPFLGQPINGGRPCKVVYLALENLNQVMRDLAANLNGRDPGRNLRITGATVPRLTGPNAGGILARSPDSWAERSIGDADLVILDTYSALLGREGLSEVAGGNALIAALSEACGSIGAALLVLGHNRKGGSDEKGTAAREAFDSMVPIIKESQEPGRLVVRLDRTSPLAKVRCGAPFETDVLAMFLPRGEGMYLDSYKEVGPSKPGPKKGRPSSAVEQTMAAVVQIGGQVTVKQLEDATGKSSTALSKDLKRLVEAGKLVEMKKGSRKWWSANT